MERDNELITMIIELENKFWKCVKNGTPPPIDGGDVCAKYLADKYSESVAKSAIELPFEAERLLKDYNAACQKISAVTEEKQLAENKLKQLLGDHEVGTFGENIVSWKSVSSERLDTKTLKAEPPALYKKYAITTTYRRFSVKSAE